MIFKNVSYLKIKLYLKLISHEFIKDFLKFKNDQVFLLIFTLGFIFRLIHLSQPIKGDEASTFLSYIEPINPLRVFVYTLPNNHVLHTILTKISTSVFGNSLVSIRLPSFLASLGIIYLVYAICKRLGQNGLFGASVISIWPYLIAYASNSRGYSLFCLLSLLLVYTYLIFRKNLSKIKILFISIISSLGIYTIPTFIIFVCGFYSWIALDNYLFLYYTKKRILKNNVFFFSFTSIFSIVLYFPVFLFSPSGYKSIISNNYVQSLPINIFFENIVKSLYSTSDELLQFLPSFYLSILLIFLIIGFYGYFRDSNFLALLLLPLILLASIIIISIRLVIPPERTWIFLIPYFLIIIDNGFSFLIFKINFLRKKFLFNSIIFPPILLASLIIINPFLQKSFTDIDAPAFPEAEQTIKYLESQRILIGKEEMGSYYLSGTTMPLNFYNWFHNGKLYFNNNKIYTKKNLYESFRVDWERFLNSDWQQKRDRINDFDFYIVNTRNAYIKDDVITYEKLVNNYPLVMKAGPLEIYSSKIKSE